MKTKTKQKLTTILTLSLILGLCQTPNTASAATVKLNKKKLFITVGKTATINVKGTKKKAKWTVKSGKKYIKLKAKKKASVKVEGVRKGTAKVLCKVGKKKLICKVNVKLTTKPTVSETPKESTLPTIKPSASATPTATPVVTPTMEPSPVPTHPFDAYEMITLQTPGPVAEYDCLKVETVLCKQAIYPTMGGSGIYGYYFFETDIQREEIEKITLTDTSVVPQNVLGSVDLSEKENGSVMAWYVDEDEDGYYEMTIGQDGGVIANKNSSYLFLGIGSSNDQLENTNIVCGLENLKTNYVENMSYMFKDCGAYTMTTLDFKNGIDVSNVTNVEGMFFNAGHPYKFRCYTTNETFYQWLVKNAESSLWRTEDYGCWWEYELEDIAYIIHGSPSEQTRPTHPPTEDCLMAEPVAVLTESGTVETYSVEKEIKEQVHMYFYGSDILREDIEFMTITDTTDVPENALGTMDISGKQNGSVIAWYTDEDNDGDYEMTIGQDGGVVMNEYSSYLFYGIGQNAPTDHPEGELFAGFDKLYQNSEGTIYGLGMFACCGDSSGSFKKLDLGAFSYETFLIPIRDRMFWNCGNPETTKYYMHSDFMHLVLSDEYDVFGGSDIMNIENMIAKY